MSSRGDKHPETFLMNINRHKLPFYQKGLRAMSMLQNI